MDKSVEQISQDLALANYAKTTQARYLDAACDLSGRFDRPLAALSREEVRTYVEELTARGRSASWLKMHLAALVFLYEKTLGRPERVSFITFPKQYSPLPTVLSLEEVGAALGGMRHP